MASYQKRDNGLWSVRFGTFDNEGNAMCKRLSGYKKKIDAERAYREYLETATVPSIKKIKLPKQDIALTFGELYHRYHEWQTSRVKESTLFDYRSVFGKHILPKFENIPVDKIKPVDILDWQQYMNSNRFSFAYKEKSMRYFSSVFNFGQKYYDLTNNPLSNIDKFKRTETKQEMSIWSENDFHQFIASVDNIMYKTFFATLYLSGARVGEILALTWSDINYTNNTITISKSITRKTFNIDKTNPFAVSTPKNSSSYRKVIMPQTCISLIKQLQSTTDGEYVFNGSRPLPETSYQRKFREYCELANVQKIRIHDLRHSHVSLLISHGENIVLIAKRLGHSNIEQTLNTYSHLMPNADQELVTKLNFDL